MNTLSTFLERPHAEKAHLGAVFTPAEIAGQAACWPDTFERVRERRDEIQRFLAVRGLRDGRESRPMVSLIGAGTSDYAGRCLCALLREQWDCDVEALPSTTLLASYAESLRPERPRLWISISRSGNSPEGVAVLERALEKNPEIAHIVISCSATGKMARLVEHRDNCLSLVLGEQTNDKSLAMTASFTNMVVCGQALAHIWSLDAYGDVLSQMCEAAEPFLDIAAQAAETFAEQGFARACFLGSGTLAAVAAECALKLLELTAGQVKTMSETTLGLRHGPMSALDTDTLLVQFLSTDATRRHYELDLLREIEAKQLVGAIVAVQGAERCELGGLETVTLLAPPRQGSIADHYRAPLDVIFGQCLGLFQSLRLGLSPDSPSPNGAISRVVPAFTIY